MHGRHSIQSNKVKTKSKKSDDLKKQKSEEFLEKIPDPSWVPTVGLQMKPGFMTTFMLLNVLGVAVQPALAVLVPHQSAADKVTQDLPYRVHNGGNYYDTETCIISIRNAARANDVTRNRIDKTLRHERTPDIFCASTTATFYNHEENRMYIRKDSEVSPATINRVMSQFLTYQRHITQHCPSPSTDDALFPLYPNTPERADELRLTVQPGNDRIKEFHRLLESFKNLDAGQQLKITAAASSGDTRLREFKKLLFQHRYRDKLNLSTHEIDTLERYINASRDCLHFKLNNKTMKDVDYNKLKSTVGSHDAIYLFDPETNSHISHQGWHHQGGIVTLYDATFTHKFDVVAHLVDYISVNYISDVGEQVYAINAILSENAMDVFYPELKKLLLEDELKCENKLKM